MKTRIYLISFILLVTTFTLAQDLTFKWEASVYYGTYGQRTVCADTMLVHVSGRSYHYTLHSPGGYNAFSFAETYDPDEGRWLVKGAELISRNYVNAEYYNGKVYIFNGATSGDGIMDDLEIYDIAGDFVTFGADIPIRRRAAGSAIIGDKIYIVGGSDYDGNYYADLSIYDISTDSWSTGAPLPVAKETEMVAYDGNLYVLGGYENGNVHDEVHKYDVASNSWTQIGTMPKPTSAHKLAAYNGYIISVGDYVDLNRVLVYNISANTWKEYSSNLVGRRHASTVVMDGRLYYIGGNSGLDGQVQYYRINQSLDLQDIITGVAEQDHRIPQKFDLGQNYPNPFNPSTTIKFSLAKTANVQVKIYNSLGQEIKTLLNGSRNAGAHELIWNGRNSSGNIVPSGQYLYQITVDGNTESKKMMMLK